MLDLNGEKLKYWCLSIITINSFQSSQMTQSKKVQFTVQRKDIVVELRDSKKGIYWSYPDTITQSGPFNNERIAIEDAKLYSTYGTTSKQLLKVGSLYPKPSRYTGGYNSGRVM